MKLAVPTPPTAAMLVESADEALALRIDAYLDGLLSPADTRATERMLAEPEVAARLAEALALREVLGSAADAPTPAGLADRIIGALGLAEGGRAEVARAVGGDADAEGGDERAGVGEVALYGASWMVRGASGGGGSARAGVGAVRYALGPLALLGAANAEEDEEAPPKRSWWRLGRRR